jgi:hypothetical protein
VLVELTGNNSQMFEGVMGHLLEVVMDENTENVFYELLQIDAARLRLILENKTVRGLVRKCVIRDNGLEWLVRSTNNLDVLLESKLTSWWWTFLQEWTRTTPTAVAITFCTSSNPKLEVLLYILSYGFNLNEKILHAVYHTQVRGCSKTFTILLHLDLKLNEKEKENNVLPTLIYDVTVDFWSFFQPL